MQDTGCKIQDARCRIQDAGCKMQDTGCRPRVRVFRRQVPGTGYQVSGTGYLVPGTGYPAPEPVRRRGPDTEHRRPSPAPARSRGLGHGGMRGKGDTTFPYSSSRPRAENRKPDTESGARYPIPGTWLPYCPIALLPYCPIALLPDYLLNLNRAVIRMQDGTLPSPWPYPASCILHPASCILYPASYLHLLGLGRWTDGRAGPSPNGLGSM